MNRPLVFAELRGFGRFVNRPYYIINSIRKLDVMENYIVDRIEGNIAILERGDGVMVDVPLSSLPKVKQGDFLVFIDGVFSLDKEGLIKRKEEIRKLQDKLRKK